MIFCLRSCYVRQNNNMSQLPAELKLLIAELLNIDGLSKLLLVSRGYYSVAIEVMQRPQILKIDDPFNNPITLKIETTQQSVVKFTSLKI